MDNSYDRDYNDTSVVAPAPFRGGEQHGWHKVSYAKRRKNQSHLQPDGTLVSGEKSINVFRTIEDQSEDRIRRIEAQRRALEADDLPQPKSKGRDEDDGDSGDSEAEDGREKGIFEDNNEKKVKKKKKEKKSKVSVAEAAAKLDSADLAAFLLDVSCSYGSQEDIRLMRFTDYFGRAFASVDAAQFRWVKLLRHSPVSKIAEIPLSHIPDPVYITSVEWINQHSFEALNSFVLWLLDSILSDLASQSSSVKGSKKVAQAPSPKSQVALFVALAMVLRRKPDVLMSLLAALKDHLKYQGQDKLLLIIWIVSQASQGDLSVGVYLWAHYLLPMLSSSKSSNNPLSRDLILQLIERILSAPKACSILVNGATRKGERLIPPSALEVLIGFTFPAHSARLKATERFEAIYPTLKEVALAGVPGSKGIKQVAQQLFNFAIKAAAESTPELAEEAKDIFIWCLSQSNGCYKQWDNAYLDNLEASVAILKKLSVEWKQLKLNESSLECFKETLSSFGKKNEKELAGKDAAAQQVLLRDSGKYIKVVLGRVSRGGGCLKAVAVLVVAMGVGAFFLPPGSPFDGQRLSVLLSSFSSKLHAPVFNL